MDSYILHMDVASVSAPRSPFGRPRAQIIVSIYRPTIRVLALECLHGTSRTAGSVSVRLSVGLYTVHPLSRPLRMSRSMFISKCIKSRDRTLLYPPHDRLSVCSRAGSVAYLPTRLRNHADGDFPLTTKVSQSVSI